MSEHEHEYAGAPRELSGKCARCGAKLSNVISVMAGMGPICRGKVGLGGADGQPMNHIEEVLSGINDQPLHHPLTKGVVLVRRADGTVLTNVPHLVVVHSPTGYEFGYGGSGPADLALNIAEWFLRRIGYNDTSATSPVGVGSYMDAAWLIHQDLKWRFVAPVDRAGGIIPFDELAAYINDWLASHDNQAR